MELVWQKVFVMIISFIFTFSHSFNLFQKEFKEVYKALRQNKFISRKQRKGKIRLPKQDGARNAISTWLDILFAPLILFPPFSTRLLAPACWASPLATGFTEFWWPLCLAAWGQRLVTHISYELPCRPPSILPHLCNMKLSWLNLFKSAMCLPDTLTATAHKLYALSLNAC